MKPEKAVHLSEIELRIVCCFFIYVLLAIILLSGCAPATANPLSAASPPAAQTGATLTPLPPLTPSATVKAMTSSHRLLLEPTDPATVKLASGGLQLVEFFRFT
jgi:hypothetical protein